MNGEEESHKEETGEASRESGCAYPSCACLVGCVEIRKEEKAGRQLVETFGWIQNKAGKESDEVADAKEVADAAIENEADRRF